MRNGKLFLAAAMAFTFAGGATYAQPSGAVTSGVQIVYEAENLANRQSVQDMIEKLIAAGFTYIEVSRTFLGRVRVIGYSATESREVVMNATTGEVLRDLVQANNGN
ncbi:MAG: hypothetical protein WD046_10450, partial [Paracoccaceae bacterium]